MRVGVLSLLMAAVSTLGAEPGMECQIASPEADFRREHALDAKDPVELSERKHGAKSPSLWVATSPAGCGQSGCDYAVYRQEAPGRWCRIAEFSGVVRPLAGGSDFEVVSGYGTPPMLAKRTWKFDVKAGRYQASAPTPVQADVEKGKTQ